MTNEPGRSLFGGQGSPHDSKARVEQEVRLILERPADDKVVAPGI